MLSTVARPATARPATSATMTAMRGRGTSVIPIAASVATAPAATTVITAAARQLVDGVARVRDRHRHPQLEQRDQRGGHHDHG